MLVLLPALPESGFCLEFDAACSENGDDCEVTICWEGESYNPLTQGDELSIKLATARTKRAEYKHENGKNIIRIAF